MDRRQFCHSAVALGVSGALSGCNRPPPEATQAETSLRAVSLDGAEIELERAAIRELGESLSGPVILAGDPQYDTARKIWNGMHDKHPALMIPNEQGVPEPPQRVHWDNAFTQRLLGLPGAYDLGPERCAWLCQGMTDWMGDAGLLTMIEARYHKFNYMGDVTRVRGRVTDKLERDGKGIVRCALECVNHRDEVTATAAAEAELPRR